MQFVNFTCGPSLDTKTIWARSYLARRCFLGANASNSLFSFFILFTFCNLSLISLIRLGLIFFFPCNKLITVDNLLLLAA